MAAAAVIVIVTFLPSLRRWTNRRSLTIRNALVFSTIAFIYLLSVLWTGETQKDMLTSAAFAAPAMWQCAYFLLRLALYAVNKDGGDAARKAEVYQLAFWFIVFFYMTQVVTHMG